MKRTHYTVKAQRARKAWKRLKQQTKKTTDYDTIPNLNDSLGLRISEMVHNG